MKWMGKKERTKHKFDWIYMDSMNLPWDGSRSRDAEEEEKDTI